MARTALSLSPFVKHYMTSTDRPLPAELPQNACFYDHAAAVAWAQNPRRTLYTNMLKQRVVDIHVRLEPALIERIPAEHHTDELRDALWVAHGEFVKFWLGTNSHARDASDAHYWRCFNFAIMAGYNHYRFLFNMRSLQPSGSDVTIRHYLARADFADLYQQVLGRGVFMYDME